MVEFFRAQNPDRVGEIENYAPAMVAAAPETMASFIQSIESDHGGFAGLAAELGVADAPDALRDLLLE
jgi:hypothetical protein